MTRVVETVAHGLPEDVVAVEDAPGGLEDRVEEAVPGRAVPEGVQPRVEPSADLVGPVDDLALGLEFFLGVAVEELGVKLFLCGGGQVLDF